MNNYLQEILKNKELEVIALKKFIEQNPNSDIAQFHHQAAINPAPNRFKKAMLANSPTIIAEIKRRSPSKGNLATIADPLQLAEKYVQGGVTAISVLTDNYGFSGSLQDLYDVSKFVKNTEVVILRKDFMLDPLQIDEAIVNGADAILLIVAVLGEKTKAMLEYAKAKSIDAIVEVHNLQELNYAIAIDAEMIGVNNRDLTTFKLDPQNALNLIKHFPKHILAIAESGMETAAHAREFLQAGFHGVLIGEALVKSDNPAEFIRQIKSPITC